MGSSLSRSNGTVKLCEFNMQKLLRTTLEKATRVNFQLTIPIIWLIGPLESDSLQCARENTNFYYLAMYRMIGAGWQYIERIGARAAWRILIIKQLRRRKLMIFLPKKPKHA